MYLSRFTWGNLNTESKVVLSSEPDLVQLFSENAVLFCFLKILDRVYIKSEVALIKRQMLVGKKTERYSVSCIIHTEMPFFCFFYIYFPMNYINCYMRALLSKQKGNFHQISKIENNKIH